ncbi:sensor domain-containing diguanylate cyclase [Vibrio coralliilyticus]|uniref:diguanylate cyclase n=2 Tax=Vibrio coralliilyticus TaxID=190893 RepID=A0AAN0SHL8_9VIBR|nr:sensor domain-containing diguanylate cyclase [Vibrio coralliilyticus]AIW21476.1 diguanylate cyclase [Vibrio coralliilyticus]NOH42108.1 sensor domain-containing diguanylate cyclase [Vibrio coralliilyticus]
MSGYKYGSCYYGKIEDVDWERWQKLVDMIALLFDAPAAFVTQATTNGIEVLVASEKAPSQYYPGAYSDKNTNVYCHQVVQSNQMMYVADASEDEKWSDNPEYTEDQFSSYLGYPIQWPDGNSFGTLCVMDQRPTDYSDKLMTVLSFLRDTINSDLAYLYKANQLKVESRFDELTKALNRRGFTESFERHISLSNSFNRSSMLMYLDIDGFKAINDQWGHSVGDQILKDFATALLKSVRKSDLVARWGGDEFVVLLDSEQEVDKSRFVERLDESLKTSCQEHIPQYSIGSVELASDTDPSKLTDFLCKADAAMYDNKSLNKTQR